LDPGIPTGVVQSRILVVRLHLRYGLHVSLRWTEYEQPAGALAWQWLTLGLVTVLVLLLTMRSVVAQVHALERAAVLRGHAAGIGQRLPQPLHDRAAGGTCS